MVPQCHQLTVSTPGRICLFGEHQDYLHLPVIPAAISLRLFIAGSNRTDRLANLQLPDIRSEESFHLNEPLRYVVERDYLRSTINVLLRRGFTFGSGFECCVRGTIPINAGTSSSSALIVSWVNFLAQMSDQHAQLAPEDIARYAHEAEVIEFGEPGGMMDQYSTACGGMLYIEFLPELKVERLTAKLKTFVLGDSGEPKDTKGILASAKNRVLAIVDRLSQTGSDFSLKNLTDNDIDRWKHMLSSDEFELLKGTVRNHMITLEVKGLFQESMIDDHRLGDLLNQHQRVLRDVQKISTLKIDRMLDAAMDAGAIGGKINGSGGGGCMFVYAPEQGGQVAEAIQHTGGKAYIVTVDEGTRNESVLTPVSRTTLQ